MGTNSKSGKFQQHIKSEVLREEKLITAPTKTELRIKVERQKRLWKEHEAHVDRTQIAERKTQEAQTMHAALTGLLRLEVQKGTKPGWKVRGHPSSIYPPPLKRKAPTYEDSARLFVPPPLNPLLEMFTRNVRKERDQAEALAEQHYQQALAQYEQERAENLNKYQQQKRAYEQGDIRATKFVLWEILWNLDFPCGFGTEFLIDFDKESEEAIIEMQLPHVSAMPIITRYRYIRQQKKIDEVKLKTSEIRDRYQDLLAQ